MSDSFSYEEGLSKPQGDTAERRDSGFSYESAAGQPERRGVTGHLRDSVSALGSGTLSGGQMVANVAGADNPVAQGLGRAAERVRGFESAARREERAERARTIKEAEESGNIWREVGANLGAFTEAPIDTTLEALGTSLPTLAASVLTRGRGAAPAVGAAQGAGAVKGSIYEQVEQAHLEAGATPEEAAERASQAQSYGSDNAGQIAIGAGLGALAGGTGIESAVGRMVGREAGDAAAQGVVRSTVRGAATEAPLEALQGGQERLAGNIAEQGEGFDTPTWQGVAGSAALEGVAGAAVGGGFGAVEGVANRRGAAGMGVEGQPDPEVDPALETEPEAQPGFPGEVPQQYRRETLSPAPAMPGDLAAAPSSQPARPPRPSEQMGINPDAGPLSAGAAIAVDSGVSPVVTPEPQDPMTMAAGAWDSMNAFERGAAARDVLGGDSSVIGRQWGDLSADQQQALAASVNQQQGQRWTDPNRRAPDQQGPVLQNRDRSSPASVRQMNEIANRPDYDKVSYSRTFMDGAPVVLDEIPDLPPAQLGRQERVTTASDRRIPIQYAVVEAGQLLPSNRVDGISINEYSTGAPGMARAIAGNGRVAGLVEAWGRGTAQEYKQRMIEDAEAHGIPGQVIEAMQQPVLVRLMPQSEATDNIGDVSNTPGQLGLDSLEQAKTDMNRVSLQDLQFGEDGQVTTDTVMGFVRSLPSTENLVVNGTISREARDRLEAAIFHKAYGSDELTRMQAERDEDSRSIISALLRAAPSMIQLEGAGPYDVRPLVSEAAAAAINARRRGMRLSAYIQQQEMGANPEIYPILEMMLNERGNIRSGDYIGEQLIQMAQMAYDEASASSTDLFGERPRRSADQVIQDSTTGVEGRGQLVTGSPEGLGEQGRAESAAQVDAGQADDGAGPAGVEPAAGAAQEGAGAPELTLESQTEESLAAQAARQQQAAREEQQAQERAAADAQVDSFTLTGSDRPADEAAARGQGDLLSGSTSERVESAARQTNTSPTEAQKEAGNYAKGHVSIQGLDIAIENPRGSERSGTDPDGNEWRHTMSDHYGYIKRTTGADGEQVDVYVGPNPDSDRVFVVDQIDQQTDGFDEHKVMIGFNTRAEAVSAYRSNFDEGWKVGPVRAMSMDEFKSWLRDGDTASPLAQAEESPALRRTSATPSTLPRGEVQKIAARLVTESAMARRFVFTSWDNLPKQIKDTAAAQGARPGDVRAVHWRGKTYMVDRRFTDARDVEKTIFHEHFAHYGLRQRYGKELEGQMNRMLVRVGGVSGLRRMAESQGFTLDHYVAGAMGDRSLTASQRGALLMDELLAHMAESTGTLRQTLQEWLGVVRNWLRQNGFAQLAQMNAADLSYELRMARMAAQSADANTSGDPVFRRDQSASETIDVNGTQRPTTNSEGRPIHPTEEGLRNFWNWFGDSKVVDAEGRPLVVYHGTSADFATFDESRIGSVTDDGWYGRGFYFTPNQHWTFAEDAADQTGGSANVMPVYLSIQNPVYADAYAEQGSNMVRMAKERGRDGVIVRYPHDHEQAGEIAEIIVWDNTQIKSAVGNDGGFDPNTADIRFSFAGEQARTANRESLSQAKAMAERGAPNSMLQRMTGWHIGQDGKWRFEISDDEAVLRINPGEAPRMSELMDRFAREMYGKEYDDLPPISAASDRSRVANAAREQWYQNSRLGNVLDHPKLFAAYPSLADIQVEFAEMAEGRRGTYYERSNRIEINRQLSPEDAISTLLHEVQHAIQATEGWARGGNMSENFIASVRGHVNSLAGETDRDLQEWREKNQHLLTEERQAAEMLRNALKYESVERLMAYANREKPSGVFRLIRNELQWIHHEDMRGNQRARDIDYMFYEIPKRGPQRNARIRDIAYEAAQVIRDTIPAEVLRQLREDERATKSIVDSLRRRADRARSQVRQQSALETRRRQAQRLNETTQLKSPYSIYRSLAGEVEARLTQARLGLSEAERRNRPVSLDRDTEEDEVIVVYRGGEVELPATMLSEGAPQEDVRFSRAPAVDTPEFKRWFGKSVVTEDGKPGGKPLAVYHGTGAEFNVFEGDLFYFTPDSRAAQSYGDRTIAAHLSIKRPLDLRDMRVAERVVRDVIPDALEDGQSLGEFGLMMAVQYGQAEFKAWAESNGYDGLILPTTTSLEEMQLADMPAYVAFRPEQIKSAIGNRGTFDPTNPDIRFSRSPSDYGMDHRPLTVDGGAATLDNLDPVFGDDIYSPNALQYYGSGDPREREVLRIMKQLRGKPDAEVTIYRGAPAEADGINPGDWVTLSKSAAEDYANQHDGGKVLSLKVPASHVTSWADSLLEFGYYPADDEPRFSRAPAADTPEFKRWFGDSKVVDAEGRPLVVYHGTNHSFDAFDGRDRRGSPRNYFAADPGVAAEYADSRRDGGNVLPVYLSLQNPLELDGAGADYSLIDYNALPEEVRSAIPEALVLRGRDDDAAVGLDAIADAAETLGRDGVIARNVKDAGGPYGERNATTVVITFRPEQIKSAIGNVGTFDPSNPDIRFSRRAALARGAGAAVSAADRVLGRAMSMPESWTDAQKKAAAKFDTFVPKQPIASAIQNIRGRALDRATQLIFDQFRPLKKISERAFKQAHLSRATDGALEALATRGVPVLRDGAIAIDERSNGFMGALAKLGSTEEASRFLMWVAGNRADRLMADGRENLFSKEDIDAMKEFAEGKTEDGKVRRVLYGEALKQLNTYNKAVLDIAEQAGLINGESRQDWESEFYIPFYRVLDDGKSAYGHGQTGLVRQNVVKQLKGGTENLGDPLENLMQNWHSLMTASMRNMAAREALSQASKMGIAERLGSAQTGTTWTMEGGQKIHWQVEDTMLVDALESLNFTGYNNPAMRAASKMKQMLTIGVTISPTFRVRNLIRDTLQAVATADVSYNPIRNAIDGWRLTDSDSDTMVQLMAGGGAVRFGSFNDGLQSANTQRLIAMGVKDNQIIDSPKKMASLFRRFYDGYQEFGDRAETINRAAIYDRVLRETGSHLDASFAARDLMNFTSMGSSAAVRALTQVLPFFNARLQGMDRLVRGAAGDPRRFWSVTGTIAMASALLYLLQSDDEEYKALPDYVRDTYWPIKIGDAWAYIPKPFEVGSLGTVVERFTELAVSDGDYMAKDFKDSLIGVLVNTLALNPVPQIVRPAGEAWFNYDMFRRQPIDSMGMERLLPEDRYTANTSAAAIAAGRAFGVSPQKVEHLMRGYFGWLGTQALNVGDMVGRTVMDLPESPRRDMSQLNNWFIVGDFLKESGTVPSKYTERFYTVQRDINAIYASANNARKSGDMERFNELMSQPEMRARPRIAAANRQITAINQRIRQVTADRTLSAAEKNQRLEDLRRRREAIAQRVDRSARM